MGPCEDRITLRIQPAWESSDHDLAAPASRSNSENGANLKAPRMLDNPVQKSAAFDDQPLKEAHSSTGPDSKNDLPRLQDFDLSAIIYR